MTIQVKTAGQGIGIKSAEKSSFLHFLLAHHLCLNDTTISVLNILCFLLFVEVPDASPVVAGSVARRWRFVERFAHGGGQEVGERSDRRE